MHTISSARLLSPNALADALALPDLSDPRQGGPTPHALALLLPLAVDGLASGWGIPSRLLRLHPVVPVDDNYDRLGYEPAAVTRDARYTRYVSQTCVLRGHTSAGVPYALRSLAAGDTGPDDVLLALPGLVYRRDAIDRLHTGTPHQLDLWRVSRTVTLGEVDLEAMIASLLTILLPGMEWRTTRTQHPYTERGRQVDVRVGQEWVEVAECGLAAAAVLDRAGLPTDGATAWTGLALGMGLDRILMLRKNISDIRLLRSADPRVVGQMHDLLLYRPVSTQPPVRRDLSVAISPPVDVEALGDRVRESLGQWPELVASVEAVELLSVTTYDELPATARARIGIAPGQVNALVRVVLRPVDRTLCDKDANLVRDRIYAALHEGSAAQWAGPVRPASVASSPAG